ncbi:Gfo/Idh/MocA family protein [Ulvibacterium sp.]|uniref:Gfo/Idh/MocA family protein n=1 Tax=Ulvibacterium sp. TaxID=2665914 RepID=UPI003BAB2B96
MDDYEVMNGTSKKTESASSRRTFLKASGLAMVGSSLAYPSSVLGAIGPFKEKTLKVGLIGCGGRGTGAAAQALQADENVVLHAMGDIFEDRLETSYTELLKVVGDKMKVEKENKFIGFDAYQKVIDSGVDVVLLTTPPAFRPGHLTAAIAAGKHAFCEKPVAVDAPGVREVIAAAEKAKAKNLSIVSGFTYRFGFGNRAAFDQILNGAIGDIGTVTTFRFGGELWYKERQPEWTEMTYNMRNWYYYNWLSGDFIVEQAVHSLDLMSWAMGDVMPLKAIGTGGRQVRTDKRYGNIYDHFAVEFEYANGAKGYHFTRQQSDTATRNTIDIFGAKGTAMIQPGRKYQINGPEAWRFEGEENNMYQTQHNELFEAIRKGKPINDGKRMAHSSLLAIWARNAGYTGKEISWEQAYNSNESLGPKLEQYNWDLVWPSPSIAVPGKTKIL